MEQVFNAEMEIENLKSEMKEIKELLKKFIGNQKSEQCNIQTVQDEYENFKNIHPMKNMHPDSRINEIMDNLCAVSELENRTGSITYLGVFSSGGRQSNWIQNELNTDDLLTLIENKSASSVLQCIGNNDRLNLLLALLKKPMNVSGMVESCGFNSTGQVYHHLKPLIAADIVFEDEHSDRGVYAVKPHRVQGIIMLLAGIADLTNNKYSVGNWDKK